MKNEKYYKAAYFIDDSFDTGFWLGFAVDKQINFEKNSQIANYSIHEFLLSDFRTTTKAGTMRFAQALREASKMNLSIDTKSELVAMTILA